MSSNKKTLIDGDFQVGSDHFKVDTVNNYVGFNNATPQNKIDVQVGTRTGTHSTGKPLYVTGVTSTSGAEFVSDDGTAGIGIGSSNIFTTETNQNITIAPDGTGAVGIKTDTPNPSGETFDLWVQGDTKITGNVTVGTIIGDGSGLTNIISSQWDSSSEDIYFLNNSGSGSGRVAIGTSTPVSLLTLEGTSGGAPPTTGQEGTSNALVRVRDDNNVTLDIGTSSGTSWLQSSDATAMGTNYAISINPNGGNVGVGTISPNVPLEVNKSAGGEIVRLTTSTGTLYAGADADPPWFGTSSDDHLRLMTNGTEKVRIESGGNVGIGITSPGFSLDVDGDINFTGNLYENGSLFVNTPWTIETSPDALNYTAGNVGIGTTTAAYTLDVDGDINFTGNLYEGGSLFVNTPWTIETSPDALNYTAGNVGIGGVNPSATLEVTGNTHISSNLSVGGTLTLNTITAAALHSLQAVTNVGNVTSNTVQFTNPTTGLVVDSNIVVTGNVTAGYLYGDASNVTAVPAAQITGTLAVANGGTGTTTSTGSGSVVLSDAPTFTGDVTFDTNTLFVDSANDRVGVGTKTPGTTLDVLGNGAFLHAGSGTPHNSNDLILRLGGLNNGGGIIQSKCAIIATPDTAYGGEADYGRNAIHFCIDNSQTDTNASKSNHRISIKPDGLVGIRNANPVKRLHIKGYSNEILAGLDHVTAANDEHVGLGFGVTDSSQGNRIFKGGIFFERKGGITGRGDLLFCIENTGDNTSEVSPANEIMRITRNSVVGITGNLSVTGNATFDTDTLFVDSVNDRVGIGTTDPIGKLDVRGAIMTPVVSYSSNQDAPYLIAGTSGYTGAATNWDTHGFQHRIKTDSGGVPRITVDAPSGGEVFSIVNGGNVGIGTTSPDATLDVRGSGQYEGIYSKRIWVANIGDNSGDGSPDDNTGSPWRGLGFDNLAWNNQSYKYSADIPILSGYNGVALRSGAGNLVLTEAGNVGIGTTNPTHVLHVHQNLSTSGHQIMARIGGDTSSYNTLVFGSSYGRPHIGGHSGDFASWADLSLQNDLMILQQSTNRVGIGQVNPSQKLEVAGNIRLSGSGRQIYFDTGGAGLYWGDGYSRIVDDNDLRICTDDNLHFNTGSSSGSLGTERMVILANGNVGIGQVTPGSRLHIDPQTNSTGQPYYTGCYIYNEVSTGDSTCTTRVASGSAGDPYYSMDVYGEHGWAIGIDNSQDRSLRFSARWDGFGNTRAYISTTSTANEIDFTGQHRSFVSNVPHTEYLNLEGLIVSANKNQYFDIQEEIVTGVQAIKINESLPLVSISNVAYDKSCFGVISGSEDTNDREYSQGSFVSVLKKQEGDIRAHINSVGEGAIWVTNLNGTLESGDYITTSNIAGYGQKQDSEFLANYTVAKITMDCDFEPTTQPVQIIKKELQDVNYWVKYTYDDISEEEYTRVKNLGRRVRIIESGTEISQEEYENHVKKEGYTITESNTYIRNDTTYQRVFSDKEKEPKEGYQLEVRNEPVNVLDEHGQIQWEDDPSGATEKAYKIRYLDADGSITDEANHVYKAAFVGCTYHCG